MEAGYEGNFRWCWVVIETTHTEYCSSSISPLPSLSLPLFVLPFVSFFLLPRRIFHPPRRYFFFAFSSFHLLSFNSHPFHAGTFPRLLDYFIGYHHIRPPPYFLFVLFNKPLHGLSSYFRLSPAFISVYCVSLLLVIMEYCVSRTTNCTPVWLQALSFFRFLRLVFFYGNKPLILYYFSHPVAQFSGLVFPSF